MGQKSAQKAPAAELRRSRAIQEGLRRRVHQNRAFQYVIYSNLYFRHISLWFVISGRGHRVYAISGPE